MSKTKFIILILFIINLSSINCANNKERQRKKNYTEIATNEELQKLSQEIFELDTTNILSKLHVNYQGRFRSLNLTDDLAPEPLLTYENELTELDTIKHMIMMYDNYERNSSVNEIVTDDERQEEKNFINSLLSTAVMKKTINFLESKNLVGSSEDEHYTLLHSIWFGLYPRNKGTHATSSGFEHVFLSELKKKKTIGLHSWIYMAMMEKSGELDYKGWIDRVDLGDKAVILTIKLAVNGYRKNLSSIIIGTPPELEFALFTLCFKTRANRKCPLSYNDIEFNVNTYSIVHKNNKLVGTAYADIKENVS
ncbi:hypothetical protein ACKWTF_006361 [Chironomus riparius]